MAEEEEETKNRNTSRTGKDNRAVAPRSADTPSAGSVGKIELGGKENNQNISRTCKDSRAVTSRSAEIELVKPVKASQSTGPWPEASEALQALKK